MSSDHHNWRIAFARHQQIRKRDETQKSHAAPEIGEFEAHLVSVLACRIRSRAVRELEVLALPHHWLVLRREGDQHRARDDGVKLPRAIPEETELSC